jgi:hypothetical protein
MEEAILILDYLPLSFKTDTEQEYITFLWDTFNSNYESGKYQFAFLAYHMLTMSFVYFNLWQIKQSDPINFAKGLIGFDRNVEKNLLDAATPFDFSTVKERSVLRLLKLIECDSSQIGKYAKLVDDRNDSAHPNGHIYYSTAEALEIKVLDILRSVREIQAHSHTNIVRSYKEFLVDSLDVDEREYLADEDQIREVFIHKNYISLEDLRICAGADLTLLLGQTPISSAMDLHLAVCGQVAK